MPLRPEDVVRKTFSRARLRGYDTNEVDAFLEEVVVELTRLQGEVDELRAADSLERPGASGPVSVLAAEREQLEQVRRERADLVREIVHLQERYDSLRGAGEDAQGTSTASSRGVED